MTTDNNEKHDPASPVVKQSLTTAAAQEAVGWQWRWLDTDNTWSEWVDGGSRKEIDARFARWKADGEDHRMQVRPLFAAPVTTAPAGVTRAVADEAPFGLNAAERAAWARGFNDALEAAITPAAPGIDLHPIRYALKYAAAAARENTHSELAEDFDELIRKLDASPKGGSEACERIAAMLHQEATDEPWTVCGVEHDGPDRAYYRELARRVLDAAQSGDAEVQP